MDLSNSSILFIPALSSLLLSCFICNYLSYVHQFIYHFLKIFLFHLLRLLTCRQHSRWLDNFCTLCAPLFTWLPFIISSSTNLEPNDDKGASCLSHKISYGSSRISTLLAVYSRDIFTSFTIFENMLNSVVTYNNFVLEINNTSF